MTQPPNPVPPRGNRPQLFSEPTAKAKPSARARGHADFGPSILATIDGGQARIASSRDRVPAKRVLLMSVLALVVAAGYVGAKFYASRATSAPEAVVVRAPVVVKAVEPAASVVPMVVAQGAAAIETVTQPVVPASAPVKAEPNNVVASLNNIQLALDRSEPAPLKKEKPAIKEAPAVTRGAPTTAPPVTNKPATRGMSAPDNDAELLAAMLPHLKRKQTAPTSPAYEKRCGQLTGDAAADCRAKFCNGRLGTDAACPVVVQP